ncbi:MAG: methylamine utilization protein [Candidatus Tectomicrobia bacterium]|uniref:Methylamine utilization protein n=1 Tax=Tectimicrobiota bacterium TaxID=2528274 RepID=A0A932CRN6_UNCTE|nr:methylamine utilization protein [Candidatus Tectomicrobia bacterium]
MRKRIWLQLPVQIVALSVAAQVALGGTLAGEIKLKGKRAAGDAVVYLEGALDGKRFSPPANPVIMDQRDLVFVPHVLPVVVGTTVEFPNNDDIRHNVYSPSPVKRLNLGTYPPKTTKKVIFDKPGVVKLLCNVHDEMLAFILVLENPYYAPTDGSGHFTISGVPPGRYRAKVWHEKFTAPAKTVEVTESGLTPADFQLGP